MAVKWQCCASREAAVVNHILHLFSRSTKGMFLSTLEPCRLETPQTRNPQDWNPRQKPYRLEPYRPWNPTDHGNLHTRTHRWQPYRPDPYTVKPYRPWNHTHQNLHSRTPHTGTLQTASPWTQTLQTWTLQTGTLQTGTLQMQKFRSLCWESTAIKGSLFSA